MEPENGRLKRLEQAEISAVKIKALSDCIIYEHSIILHEFKGMPIIKQAGNQIKNNTEIIFKALKAGGVNPLNKENAEKIEDHTLELWNTLDFVFRLSHEELEEFNKNLKL